ncbi:MAG: FG-GAP-like repeat-containing protein [Burkholderiales bacterium]
MKAIIRCLAFSSCLAAAAHAAQPGLDTRAPVGAYLDGAMPAAGTDPRPALLSATGAFANTPALTPHAGLVPYEVNSPFWSDGAVKTRYIALPFDGTIGSAGSPRIAFSPTQRWTFPAGTVFVKTFELVVNEQTGARRRLETRLLVVDAAGNVYGNSYRWRPDNTDADIVIAAQNEVITITNPDGVTTRSQTWAYPSQAQCLQCHNSQNQADPDANVKVLGVKTRQQNGDMLYAATGRTANQLNTWSQLGMLDPALPDQAEYPEFARLVPVDDPTATLEHRVRSYIDANCSPCHRPGGPGPVYDARFTTPVLLQNLAGDAGSPLAVLQRFDIAGSRLHVRASSTTSPMPPIGRNVPHEAALAAFAEWVNHPFDAQAVFSAGDLTRIRVRFDRPVETASAATASNYALDGGATVLAAVVESDARFVTLTTSPMTRGATYELTVDRVQEAQAPRNPVWPGSTRNFVAGLDSVALPDFNVDGQVDLLWRNVASGNTYAWFMSGPSLVADAFVAGIDPSWKISGIADFDGDGKPDLVWRNGAGDTYVWHMDGATFLSDAFLFSLPPEWVIQGVADFNADGKPDFLMRNTVSGNAFAWFFDDATPIGDQFLFNVDPSWKVEAVGDIDRDGQPDLLFRNMASGLSFAWYTAYAGGVLGLAGSSPPIYAIDPVWEVVQLADWNADGKPDLLFRNASTGVVFVWYLDGLVLGASDFVVQIDPSWEIVPRP